MYFLNAHVGDVNRYNSAVFDLLNVSKSFGLLEDIRNIVERHNFYTKSGWREKVLNRGWELEDIHWRIEKNLHKSLDLLSNIHPNSRYLTWWTISDKYLNEKVWYAVKDYQPR